MLQHRLLCEPNDPDYSYHLPLIFGVEVLASVLLMSVFFAVAYTKVKELIFKHLLSFKMTDALRIEHNHQ